MAPPAATAPDPPADIEDFGRVEVTQKCTGCVVCRVLAPDVFLEARADSKDPMVRCASQGVHAHPHPSHRRWPNAQ